MTGLSLFNCSLSITILTLATLASTTVTPIPDNPEFARNTLNQNIIALEKLYDQARKVKSSDSISKLEQFLPECKSTASSIDAHAQKRFHDVQWQQLAEKMNWKSVADLSSAFGYAVEHVATEVKHYHAKPSEGLFKDDYNLTLLQLQQKQIERPFANVLDPVQCHEYVQAIATNMTLVKTKDEQQKLAKELAEEGARLLPLIKNLEELTINVTVAAYAANETLPLSKVVELDYHLFWAKSFSLNLELLALHIGIH